MFLESSCSIRASSLPKNNSLTKMLSEIFAFQLKGELWDGALGGSVMREENEKVRVTGG